MAVLFCTLAPISYATIVGFLKVKLLIMHDKRMLILSVNNLIVFILNIPLFISITISGVADCSIYLQTNIVSSHC